MKVRWTEDSVRLRITPGELAKVCAGTIIQQSIAFPHGGCWKIELFPNVEMTRITFEQNAVRIHLIRKDVEQLEAPDTEGIYFESAGPDRPRFMIEKDFPCAHPRSSQAQEKDTETFEAPLGFEERKSKT